MREWVPGLVRLRAHLACDGGRKKCQSIIVAPDGGHISSTGFCTQRGHKSNSQAASLREWDHLANTSTIGDRRPGKTAQVKKTIAQKAQTKKNESLLMKLLYLFNKLSFRT